MAAMTIAVPEAWNMGHRTWAISILLKSKLYIFSVHHYVTRPCFLCMISDAESIAINKATYTLEYKLPQSASAATTILMITGRKMNQVVTRRVLEIALSNVVANAE